MERESTGTAGRAAGGVAGRGAASRRAGDRDGSRGRVVAADRPGAGADVLRKLGESVGSETVARYLGRSARLDVDGDGIRVVAPTRFAAEMIERRLGDALRDAAGSSAIRFEVESVSPRADEVRETAPLRRDAPPAATLRSRRPSQGRRGTGDPSQTLGSFLVGACNRFAYAAAARLAEGTDAETGPVFVHGPCGVGKSHLLNAAANRFREVHAGARVRVVTAEAFTNEYIAAIRSGTIESFHRAYRRVDLLCVDDVHFLASKSGTQQELLHTFDHLCGSGGRIVLASDSPPGSVRKFSEALVSRFVSGSLVRIEPPDGDLRRRLLERFAGAAGLRVSREALGVLDACASAGSGSRPVSVRDLLGAVNRLRAYRVALAGTGGPPAGEIGVADVEAAIRAQGAASSGIQREPGVSGRPARPVPIGDVVDGVCDALEVTREDLAGKGRHPRVVLARAAVTALARRLTRYSYPEIANAIGRRNHSTVITAHRRIERQMASGETLAVGLASDGEPVSLLLDRLEASLR